jgi:hypothetical protein
MVYHDDDSFSATVIAWNEETGWGTICDDNLDSNDDTK